MPLRDTKMRKFKPIGKPYKLADEKGLHLLVTPSGGKLWRMKYRFGGKERRLCFGAYPDVPLLRARQKRDEARRLVADGIDPSENRKAQKAARLYRTANSFGVIAREWFEARKSKWAPSHSSRLLKRLENDVFPWPGGRPVAEIAAPEILAVMRRIEGRGTLDTAHRAHQDCGQAFRYAVATGRAERDPTGGLRGALPKATGGHFAAITDPASVGELLRAIDGVKGRFIVRCALKPAPMLFVRPGELRQARWQEFDLDKAEWKYLATKTKTEHFVPLASQAVAILPARKAMMQQWADYLDKLKAGAEVIQLHGNAA